MRATHISQFLNPPPSPPTQRVTTNPPIHEFFLKRWTSTYTRKYQPEYSLSLDGTPLPGSVSYGLLLRPPYVLQGPQ